MTQEMSNAPILQPPLRRGNPLAPEWMLGSFVLPFCESEWTYPKTFTIPAGTEVTDQMIPVSQDSAYFIRTLEFAQGTAVLNEDLALRFRDGHGKRMCKEYCGWKDLAGPLHPKQPMAAGSQFGIDFKNTSADDITVQVILRGIKRGPAVSENPDLAALDQPYIPLWQLYSSPMPDEYDQAFDYGYLIAFDASSLINSFLLQDDDADFYLRNLNGRINGTGAQVQFQLTDHVGNSLTQGQIIDLNYFDTRQGNSIYPELYAPHGGFLAIQGRELAGVAGTIELNLKGVKRYKR
jgi:hypothetical protein